jgi:predicted ATPase
MADALEPDLADVTGHWLGFDFSSSPAVQRLLGGSGLVETARAFLVRYIRTLAAEPVVVLLEDIHWADDPSLELATYLVRTIPAARLFIVAVTRSSLFERHPNWSLDATALTRIVLRPLTKAVSQVLVGELLQRVDEVPPRLRDLISDAADGNPFYMEEMVKMLIDQGVIERGIRSYELGIGSKEGESRRAAEQEGTGEPAADGDPLDSEQWTVRADKLAALKVPPTLTALLQARLDGLPPAERAVLQRASVIGRLFWDDAVADLHPAPREAVGRALEAASVRELLLHREPSAFVGAEEYIFRHGLLHEVTYETVLLRRRAEYHRRAARWLENHAGERLTEYLTLIAEHYIRAGERQRAAALLEQSAREALELGAYAVARPVLERALALREAGGESEGPAVTAALIGLGQASLLLGDFAPAETALERGLAGARAAGDRAAEAEALAWLARIATGRGDYERAWLLTSAALPVGQALGGRLLALTEQRMAQVLWAMGDLAAAETHAAEALTASRAAGDIPGETGALNALGIIASDRRQLPQAMAMYEQSLALARRTNHLSAQALALLNLGNTAYLRGDYAAAADYAHSALERFQELGQQHNVSMALANRAQADIKLGNVAAARRGAREALALVHSLGAQPSVLWAICLFGQLLAETGDTTPALALYGLARAQPALDNQLRVEIDEEIARLDLPAETVAAGLAAGARLDLATVIDEILAGDW